MMNEDVSLKCVDDTDSELRTIPFAPPVIAQISGYPRRSYQSLPENIT